MTWSIESDRVAALPPSDIWALYVDPSSWGSWAHATRAAWADGPLVVGSTVHVKADYGRVWQVRVREMVEDRLIETEVRPPGLLVVQRFEITPLGADVRVRHEIEVSGAAAGFAGLLLKPLYRRRLERETERLVTLARARRAPDPRG